jgi:hypothetical protein
MIRLGLAFSITLLLGGSSARLRPRPSRRPRSSRPFRKSPGSLSSGSQVASANARKRTS